jgi:F-type H+-transporting ATPase subunit b
MTNWMSFVIFAHEHEGIAFNLDIIETNIVNLALLLGLMVYVVGGNLKGALDTRQAAILNNVQDAEKRLADAKNRLAEINMQWDQIKIAIGEVKTQTIQSKNQLLKVQFDQANDELTQRINNALVFLSYREKQVFNDIMEEVSKVVINQVVTKLQNKLGTNEQNILLKSRIDQLGGQL